MAANPTYTGDPISASGLLTTANINRDGTTGALVTLYTFRSSGANGGKGGRIDTMTLVSQTGASVAGNVLLFVGTTIVREIAVTAVTPSATVKGYTIPTSEGADVNGRLPLGIVCAPGDVIKALVTTTQNLVPRIEGGEF